MALDDNIHTQLPQNVFVTSKLYIHSTVVFLAFY